MDFSGRWRERKPIKANINLTFTLAMNHSRWLCCKIDWKHPFPLCMIYHPTLNTKLSFKYENTDHQCLYNFTYFTVADNTPEQGLFSTVLSNSHTHTQFCLHVVHVTWVWHLLCIYSERLIDSSLDLNDSSIHHVLQVHEPSPYIPQVIKWVVAGRWGPGPKTHMNTKPHLQWTCCSCRTCLLISFYSMCDMVQMHWNEKITFHFHFKCKF